MNWSNGLDRRAFARLSSMALAASAVPGALAQAGGSAPYAPVGFAAVGLGGISDIFLHSLTATPKAKAVALVTGHPEEKGRKFGDPYGIPASAVYTYDTYDKIRDNKAIEAVYIGLPNSMHCEFTVRAAQAGKHVLCEKPMAISSAECRRMIDACKAANVKLMIAYRIQYEPLWNDTIRRIRAGEIGRIESFRGGFFGPQRAGAWRLNRKLAGGGSLMDLGIYPLNGIRHVLQEDPVAFTAVTATRDMDGRFAEMEQSIEWTMKFPSGVIGSCGCSYGASGPSFLTMQGEKGYFEFRPAFNYDGLHLGGQVGHAQLDVSSPGKAPYQFTLEAAHFADCVRGNKEPLSDGEEGLKDMLAIEAIYQAAGHPIA